MNDQYILDLADEILRLEDELADEVPEVEPPHLEFQDLIDYALACELCEL